MNIVVYKHVEEVQKLWKYLYDGNEEMSWFQSYEWNKLLAEEYHRRKLTQFFFSKLLYVVVENQVIFPIILDYKKNNISLLGQYSISDYLLPIYSKEITVDKLTEIVNFFIEYYSAYNIVFEAINQSSRFYRVLDSTIVVKGVALSLVKTKRHCVYVPLQQESFFYETLSKNVRQNYRTGKNRISRDCLMSRVECFYGSISSALAKDLLSVYLLRRTEKDGTINSSLYSQLAPRQLIKSLFRILHIDKYFRSTDLISNYIQTNKVLCGIMYINGEIASYFIGQINNRSECASITRVATNPKFYKYSPGLILFVEVLEQLKHSIQFFDLTRGQEDYKYKLGGIVHNNYQFLYRADNYYKHNMQRIVRFMMS